ncbi:hypothetical protein TL16_g09503 [Triparma laevis f. inornata]|uniref:Uncharacterized protein n=1 Tax=Triparma laevis f. inornata TaxID=1714386 RepID=A0A9W7BBK4_9STRA|nr:hypothetical protein TL16_g09503 [Triparma laevis f. inornata]
MASTLNTVNTCDACASNFQVKATDKRANINTYKLPSDIDTLGSKGDVFDQSKNPYLEDWHCPLCQSSEKLLKAVEDNRMDLLNNLLVFEIASPHYAKRISNLVSSPLHTAALQNNYEILSMLLYGASVLIKLSEIQFPSVLPLSLPECSWPRDAKNKTPFDAAYELSINPFTPARSDALLLLAARGCGDYKRMESLTVKKINVFNSANAILEGGEPWTAEEDPAYPETDISMGMESFKIPWVNETGDGDKVRDQEWRLDLNLRRAEEGRGES